MQLARFAYRNGIWLLVPIALLLLFPAPPSSLGFLLVPVFFLLRRIALGSWLPETRVNLFILILLVMTAIGFAISPARDLAVLTAAQVTVSVTLFFFLIDQLNVPSDFVRATGILVLLGLAVSLLSPFITEPSIEPLLGTTALTISRLVPQAPKLSNPNIVAGGLAIIAPMALALIAQKTKRWRALGLVAFPLLAFAILFLESRGALFASPTTRKPIACSAAPTASRGTSERNRWT